MKRLYLVFISVLAFFLVTALLNCGSSSKTTTTTTTITNQFAFLQDTTAGAARVPVPLRHSGMLRLSRSQHGYGFRHGMSPDASSGPASGNYNIVLMNNDGSSPITAATSGDYMAVHEGYDGKGGVFCASDGTNWQIWYADLSNPSSPAVTQLTTDGSDYFSPQLSWDGKTVVYEKQLSSGSPNEQIATISVSGGTETVLATSFDAVLPAFTPDGHIVFVNDTNYYNIEIMNADGTNITALTASTTGQFDIYPSVSPDGKSISFTRAIYNSTSDTYTHDIWMMNIDGSSQTQLTTDGKNFGSRWINNLIVVASFKDTGTTGNAQIYSLDPSSKTETRLTNDSYNEVFDWWGL